MSDHLSLCPGCFEEDFPSRGQACPTCGWTPDQDRPPLALPIQTELKGRYVAGRILGEPGGFGVTYLGYDRLQSEKVAIKEYMPREVAGRDTDGVSVVPHSGTGSEEFEYGKEQFLGEAQTLAQFDHANIVGVRDFFEANGTAYLVMEYYEGKTLDAYLEELPDGRMEPEAATEVMLRVLDGLKEVHSEGYLHRDLKPENVYLTEEGRPILIDFGAAREAMGERSRSLSVVMTPGYAPYEQYSREGNQGPHTDVYGAGATLYRMVTGEKPPPATDRVIEDTLEDPREIRPEVPAELSKAIMNALRMGDQERTPDAELLRAQIDRLDEGVEGSVPKAQRESKGQESEIGREMRSELNVTYKSEENTSGTHNIPNEENENFDKKYSYKIRGILRNRFISGLLICIFFVAGAAYIFRGSFVGKEIRTIESKNGPIYSIDLNPKKREIAIGTEKGVIKIISTKNFKKDLNIKTGNSAVSAIDFSKNRSLLVSGSLGSSVKIWSTESGKLAKDLGSIGSQVTSVDFSSSGDKVVAASRGGNVIVWSENGRKVSSLYSSEKAFKDAVFLESEKIALIESRRNNVPGETTSSKIFIWSIKKDKKIREKEFENSYMDEIIAHKSNIITYKNNSSYTETDSYDGKLKLWSKKLKSMGSRYVGEDNEVSSISFSEKRNMVFFTHTYYGTHDTSKMVK